MKTQTVRATADRAIRGVLQAAIVGAALVVMSATAHADLSKKVISTFRGQILVSAEPLDSAGDDKATIAAFKKARLPAVTGEKNAEDVTVWSFYYTAFLKKTGATDLKFEFYTDDKDNRYAADKRLAGVDPTTSVLTGSIEISDDDGLAVGKAYKLRLTATIKGKETVVADTPIVMK